MRVTQVTVSMTDSGPFRRLIEFVGRVEDYAHLTADDDLSGIVTELHDDLRAMAWRAKFCAGCGEKMPDADEGQKCMSVPDVGMFHPTCYDKWHGE